MTMTKKRKRGYIPPPSEIDNRKVRGRSQRRPAVSQSRGGQRGRRRELQPPSWNRAFRRAPVIFLMVLVLEYFALGTGKKQQPMDPIQRMLIAASLSLFMTAALIPFNYLIERAQYRGQVRRQERAARSERDA